MLVSHGENFIQNFQKSLETITYPPAVLTNRHGKSPMFRGKYHQNGGFSMVMLVSGSVYFLPSPCFTAKLVRYGTCTGIDAWLGVFFANKGQKS